MNWLDILKDVEKLPTLAPKIEKLVNDVKVVVSDIEDLEQASGISGLGQVEAHPAP